MGVEKFAALVGAVNDLENSIRAMTWAFENIEGVAKYSEADTVQFFKRYDLVYGVWFDPEARTLKVHAIKGREPASQDEVMQANAIPCVDEADARRWAVLISTSDNPIPDLSEEHCRLRIATINGESVE